MLPRTRLVPLRREWERIRKTGRRVDSPSFGLIISQGQNGAAQAAFIVSKKIDKRSVVRHEIKRKLAQVVGQELDKLTPGTQLVFLAKAKAKEATQEELTDEIRRALSN